MEQLYDVIIIGGGPAGLSAAIYLARAKYRVLVIEKEKFGGQITITAEIVNYPGVESTSGKELTEAMRYQAEDFGAEFTLAEVTGIEIDEDIKKVVTAKGKEYQTLGIVLALGANPRKVGFQGEKEFQGRGVAYCATCDGEFFTGREVIVIGGGFAAAEEAMFLTKYASKVTILVRGESFSCAASVVEKLKKYDKIKVCYHTEVVEAGGKDIVNYVKLKNNQTGEEWVYQPDDKGSMGIFVFAGYVPATDWIQGQIECEPQGYIVTDRDQKTSVAGVYAAGDVCVKKLRQVVTAVSDGAVAATSLEKYVSEIREKRNLPQNNILDKSVSNREKRRERKTVSHQENQSDAFLTEDMKNQLRELFARFEKEITIAAVITGNGELNLEGFSSELAGLGEKVKIVVERKEMDKPSYLDIRVEGKSVGIRYFSIPGGHEFSSFVVALYNAAGPGQEITKELENRIRGLQGEHTLQVMTTLSCNNCPDVVMGTQKIAALSPNVEAEMYDIAKFPDIRERYKIMAVPCLVVDNDQVFFGRRGMEEILELVEKIP